MQFSKTVTSFPGSGTLYDSTHQYDIDFEQSFDPDTIQEIRISIDTSGLSYHDYACANGVPDSCDDDLEIRDVRRWNRATGSGQSNTEQNSVDTGEQSNFSDSANPSLFPKAKLAIADGKIQVAVYPTSRDNYRVHSVSLFVQYTPKPE